MSNIKVNFDAVTILIINLLLKTILLIDVLINIY